MSVWNMTPEEGDKFSDFLDGLGVLEAGPEVLDSLWLQYQAEKEGRENYPGIPGKDDDGEE